jgi:hypothetical protein
VTPGKDKRERERERERKNREERGMDFPKDLCAKLENHRDLSVNSNFPSI